MHIRHCAFERQRVYHATEFQVLPTCNSSVRTRQRRRDYYPQPRTPTLLGDQVVYDFPLFHGIEMFAGGQHYRAIYKPDMYVENCLYSMHAHIILQDPRG